ncbi:MAG TPA: NfeD family protein [Blastocatellia bacterium]|nr:NfeD family protein [Blastocatellia bacterium]
MNLEIPRTNVIDMADKTNFYVNCLLRRLDSLRYFSGQSTQITIMTAITRFYTAISLLKNSRREKRQPRLISVVGLIGRAESAIGTQGSIFVRGELWPARADVPIARGESVRVIGLNRDGLFLVVEQLPS